MLQEVLAEAKEFLDKRLVRKLSWSLEDADMQVPLEEPLVMEAPLQEPVEMEVPLEVPASNVASSSWQPLVEEASVEVDVDAVSDGASECTVEDESSLPCDSNRPWDHLVASLTCSVNLEEVTLASVMEAALACQPENAFAINWLDQLRKGIAGIPFDEPLTRSEIRKLRTIFRAKDPSRLSGERKIRNRKRGKNSAAKQSAKLATKHGVAVVDLGPKGKHKGKGKGTGKPPEWDSASLEKLKWELL